MSKIGSKYHLYPKTKEKSFYVHILAVFWHISNLFKPEEVYLKSCDDYTFGCTICNHILQLKPHDLRGKEHLPCKYCANRAICGQDNCAFCKDKTYSKLDNINKLWSDKNTKKPIEVSFGMRELIWLVCQNEECNHHYETKPDSYKRGKRCPYCSIPCHKLCKEECDKCFKKSFASHYRAEFWHPTKNGEKTPRNIVLHHNSDCFFTCTGCNRDYKAKPNQIVGSNT